MDTKDLIIIGAIFAGLLALKWVLGSLSRGGRSETTATAKTFPYGLRDAFLSAAELPLMRVKAARGCVPGEIAERIREVLG